MKEFISQDNINLEEAKEWLEWCFKELDYIQMLAWQAQEAAMLIGNRGAAALIKECCQLIDEVDEEGITKEEFLAREKKVWPKLDELFDKIGNSSEYVRLYNSAFMDISWRKEYEFNEK